MNEYHSVRKYSIDSYLMSILNGDYIPGHSKKQESWSRLYFFLVENGRVLLYTYFTGGHML